MKKTKTSSASLSSQPDPRLLQELTCPISLDIMRDPVLLVQSGISYDREYLLQSLLHYPNKDPATNQQYHEPLTHVPNVALRAVLTTTLGQGAFQEYNDSAFPAAYKAAWEAWQLELARREQEEDEEETEDSDTPDDTSDDSDDDITVLVEGSWAVTSPNEAAYQQVASFVFGLNHTTIDISAAWYLVSSIRDDPVMMGFRAAMLDPHCSLFQVYQQLVDGSLSCANNRDAQEAWMQADQLGLSFQASGGNAWAQLLLGWRFYDGLGGVARDLHRSMQWAHHAASTSSSSSSRQVNAMALFQLGCGFYYGVGLMPQDYNQALRCFFMACQQGHIGATNNIGLMHYEGIGVPQNKDEGLNFYYMAAALGFPSAQFNLGCIFSVGQTISFNAGRRQRRLRQQSDQLLAMKWYSKAAQQGHARAKEALQLLAREQEQETGIVVEDGIRHERDSSSSTSTNSKAQWSTAPVDKWTATP